MTIGPDIQSPPVVAYATPPAPAPAATEGELPLYGHVIIILILLAAGFVFALGMLGAFSGPVTDALAQLGRAGSPILLLILFGVLRSTRLTTKTGFRALVLWQFALTILSGFLAAAFSRHLPGALQAYERDTSSAAASPAMRVLMYAQLATLLAAYAGMLALWRPSRYIYLAAILLGVVYLCLSPPRVEHPVAYTVASFGDLIGGALLVILFADTTRPIFDRTARRPY